MDKTDLLRRLASETEDSQFFISRPRRVMPTASLTRRFTASTQRSRTEWKIRSEADVKRHFLLFMEMLGAKVSAEEGSAFGYADAIIETRKFVWVFEFKFNGSAAAAIRQIREKGYADAYRGDRRPVTLVGVNFRTAKRNIDEPLFAKL